MRVVLDTNVLIDGFNDDFSPAAKLLDAARDGALTAIVTEPIVREYRKLLYRLIDDADYRERVEAFIAAAEQTEPARVDVELDDADDYKFLQAAVSGRADAIVTSDRHLLDVGELAAVRILTPSECWEAARQGQGKSEWDDFARGLGIA